ncbi:hypothetical protein CHS0354_020746 [Potamilus streckersoni]|uniref:Polysaccharide biosynthesis domain-containing protein n=1 Tax=Potamilus streckersoni TaxID=2493646 RepID=A0AAE0SCB3_9BIVA|nr:hypothetical protein CHS0354_020746 [Potamilus streckersoni]
MDFGRLNATEVQAAAAALKMDPQKVTNNADVEMQWAVRAYQHAETHFNLISSVDPKAIRLTRIDDEIYTRFRQEFPDFPVEVLKEEQLKSPEAKEKWRPFCSYFENKVEDFNMGTLIRIDSRKEFSEENSMLVLRIQFLALEIARNREGYNDSIRTLKSNVVAR